MKIPMRSVMYAVAGAAALAITGCETVEMHQASAGHSPATLQDERPAPRPSPAVIQPTNKDFALAPEPVSFSSPGSVGAPNKTATSERSRQALLIGLYGELASDNNSAGSQFDGGTNLIQVTTATEGMCIDPAIDPTGKWLAFSSTMHRSTSDIYLKAVNGKTITQVTSDPADDVMPAFSPDGKTIAFASDRSGNWDIYTVSVDGGSTVQITNDADHELHPTWSPDGRHIAYCKLNSQTARWEIWVVDVANPGMRHFLDYGVFPEWCPDPAQNRILFQRAKQRGSRDYSIWTIDYVDGQAKYPTEIVSAANAALINPAWSPDGSRIVFVSVIDPNESPEARPGQSDLWIVNADGTGRTSLTNGMFANFQPVWASDSTVYFVSDRSGVDNIWAVRATHPHDRRSTQPMDMATVNPQSQVPGVHH